MFRECAIRRLVLRTAWIAMDWTRSRWYDGIKRTSGIHDRQQFHFHFWRVQSERRS